MLFERKVNYDELIGKFARFADIARRDGLLVLEHQLASVNDPSIRRAIEMMIDGQSADVIRTVLETETDVSKWHECARRKRFSPR